MRLEDLYSLNTGTIWAHYGKTYWNNKKNKAQGNSNPMPSPRLLTIKKGAEHLGLSVWALRERIWAGQIPVVQFPGGRKQYIDIQDLEAFIQNNKTTIS